MIWMWYECDMNVKWMWNECDMNVIWMWNECDMNVIWMWYECDILAEYWQEQAYYYTLAIKVYMTL